MGRKAGGEDMRGPIGIKISSRRKALAISQAELARRAGISASYLNLIEANKRDVGGALLKRLAAAGLTPTRLLSCGDLELTKSLALAGVGVALLPRRVAAYGQRGKLVRLGADMPFVEDTISLLYRGDIHRTKAAFRLKDALIAHGKTLEAESLA